MADLTPEEKETKILAAIGKVTTSAKLGKFKVPEDASDAVKEAYAAKKIELDAAPSEIDPDCVVMSKDGAEINVHPMQIEPWQRQGWTVAE